jgi:hypothetical protein
MVILLKHRRRQARARLGCTIIGQSGQDLRQRRCSGQKCLGRRLGRIFRVRLSLQYSFRGFPPAALEMLSGADIRQTLQMDKAG